MKPLISFCTGLAGPPSQLVGGFIFVIKIMAKRNTISQSKRQMIYARDAWTCVYCGLEGKIEIEYIRKPIRPRIVPRDENGNMFEIDHLLPVAKGGDEHINNLVTSCWDCNNTKRDKVRKPTYYFFRVKV